MPKTIKLQDILNLKIPIPPGAAAPSPPPEPVDAEAQHVVGQHITIRDRREGAPDEGGVLIE